MSKLTIVANIVAKQEHVDLVKSELIKLIDKTRAEQGCINYDLHQDNDNPAHFIFYENWASSQALDNHLASSHIAQYSEAVVDAVESFTLNRMTQIS